MRRSVWPRTPGLNDRVLSDEQFRQQCLDTDREREAMFFDSLDKVPPVCVCAFDGTDRMQHMFCATSSRTTACSRHPCRRVATILKTLSSHG
jgi:hypothetical protein